MNDSSLTQLAEFTSPCGVAKGVASIIVEPGFAVEQIVQGSGFHTVNGVAFGPDGRLFAGSVGGESIFAWMWPLA